MKNFQPETQTGAFRWLLATSTLFWIVGISLFLGLGATLAFPRPVYAAPCVSGSMTYGDAPSSYGQACETPNTGGGQFLRIGSQFPITGGAGLFSWPCTSGHADCNPRDNFLNPLTPIDLTRSYYTWTVPLSTTIDATVYLAGWIDFNHNGTFEANERANASVPDNAVSATLTWNIPITATPNITTYVRLRLTTDIAGSTNPVDAFGDGEVEDYEVRMISGSKCDPGTSFYFTGGASGSGSYAIHSYNVATDVESTVADPTFVGYINGVAVDLVHRFVYFQNQGTSPKAIYGYNITSGTFFTVTSNASNTPLSLPAGTGAWTAAAGAFANQKYYAGIDASSDGSIYEITLSSDGLSPVSSRFLFNPASGNLDWGDLIVLGNRMYVAYSFNGTGAEYRFEIWDINSQTMLSRQATTNNPGGDGAYQLAQTGNSQVYVIWTDQGQVYTVTNGVVQNWGGSTGRTIGVHLSDASECIPSATTAVSLSSFNARAAEGTPQGSASHIALSWATASEVNSAGFNLYRSEQADGPYVRVNEQLIPGSSDALAGGKYQYIDANVTPGKTYYYQIEDVEFNGTLTRHKPIPVMALVAP